MSARRAILAAVHVLLCSPFVDGISAAASKLKWAKCVIVLRSVQLTKIHHVIFYKMTTSTTMPILMSYYWQLHRKGWVYEVGVQIILPCDRWKDGCRCHITNRGIVVLHLRVCKFIQTKKLLEMSSSPADFQFTCGVGVSRRESQIRSLVMSSSVEKPTEPSLEVAFWHSCKAMMA